MKHLPHRSIRLTHAPAFALIEMLFCLILLSVAILVSARIFNLIIRVYQTAPVASEMMRSEQRWLTQLREDAWRARRVDVRGDGSLALVLTNQQPLVWRSDWDGSIIREGGDELVGDLESTRWPIVHPVRAAWSTGGVLLISDGTTTIPLATPSRKGRDR